MRTLVLVSLVASALVTACDRRSPNDPDWIVDAEFARVGTPSSLTATAVSATEVDLSWSKIGNQVDGYQLYRSTTGSTGTFSPLTTVGAAVTTYADPSLTGSTQYCYEVRSYRVTGRTTTYSDFSGVSCATTLVPPPPPPPPVVAPSGVDVKPVNDRDYYIDVYNSSIAISWVDNSADEDGFRIEMAATTAGPWSLSRTAAANATLVYAYSGREAPVCYRVIAYNAKGASNPSAPDCTTPPANVTGLTATVPAGHIQLTWTDNSAVEDGYKVSRRDPAATQPWTDIATLPPNTTSYVDQTATVDVTYAYRVLAMKDGGYSDNSNTATAVVASTAPAMPSDFAVSFDSYNDGYGWVYFTAWWTDNSTNEAGFRLETSVDGVTGWTTAATVDPSTSYYQENIDIFNAKGVGGCYRVVAFNSRADSPSNVSCGEWGMFATDVVATAVDASSIDVTWTDNARYEQSYLVLRSTDPYGIYDVVATLAPNTTTYHDQGLASATQYWYVIVNNYDYGPTDYSNYSDVATAATSPSPAIATSASIRVNGRVTPIRVRGIVIKKHPPTTLRIHR
ncbi:MAG TPA: fibronectin type III domain-containing protein [Gemmatimonadaceae bacterium]|nr:fibronectin type III domain-containing protein [Gemmatimonadaceae bacterium]